MALTLSVAAPTTLGTTATTSLSLLHRTGARGHVASASTVGIFSSKRTGGYRMKSCRPDRSLTCARRDLSIVATTTLEKPAVVKYTLPTWANFEMGHYPVFWETASGRPPASGEQLTIYFNPSATDLEVSEAAGVGFTGGFNAPLMMCAEEPRAMALKLRGPNCQPLYIIKVNVPVFGLTMEFVFTDGKKEVGPFQLDFEIPAKWRNLPVSFFHDNLRQELATGAACAMTIFPDSTSFADRCLLPAMLTGDAAKCDLDLVPGCTDPESPFYDPLANVDDGTCPADFTD